MTHTETTRSAGTGAAGTGTATATAEHDLSLHDSLPGGPVTVLDVPSSQWPPFRDAAGDTVAGGLLQPQRILVAGDDVTALAVLVDAVTAPQREVHSASCSELALELALQLHFDLVVLHLDRPGAEGVEVSHCIRTCHDLQQPTIVIVTRPVDEDTWTTALNSGADLVLPEPADVLETTHALRPVLR